MSAAKRDWEKSQQEKKPVGNIIRLILVCPACKLMTPIVSPPGLPDLPLDGFSCEVNCAHCDEELVVVVKAHRAKDCT